MLCTGCPQWRCWRGPFLSALAPLHPPISPFLSQTLSVSVCYEPYPGKAKTLFPLTPFSRAMLGRHASIRRRAAIAFEGARSPTHERHGFFGSYGWMGGNGGSSPANASMIDLDANACARTYATASGRTCRQRSMFFTHKRPESHNRDSRAEYLGKMRSIASLKESRPQISQHASCNEIDTTRTPFDSAHCTTRRSVDITVREHFLPASTMRVAAAVAAHISAMFAAAISARVDDE